MAQQHLSCRSHRWPPAAAWPCECRERWVYGTRYSCARGAMAPATIATASFTAMRKVVEVKEVGMSAMVACMVATCGVGMALKAMADSEKRYQYYG